MERRGPKSETPAGQRAFSVLAAIIGVLDETLGKRFIRYSDQTPKSAGFSAQRPKCQRIAWAMRAQALPSP